MKLFTGSIPNCEQLSKSCIQFEKMNNPTLDGHDVLRRGRIGPKYSIAHYTMLGGVFKLNIQLLVGSSTFRQYF